MWEAIAVWEIIVFLFNGLIFILIGLQLPTILNAVIHEEVMLRIERDLDLDAVRLEG